MQKISVIGGAGFIGTALCRLLARQGQPFEVVDLRPSAAFPARSRIADIRHPGALARAVTGRVLVHLAAVHHDDAAPADYLQTNVGGTRNLCDLARQRGIGQIVFTSSVAVYGNTPSGTDERGRIAPVTPYGHSKALAEAELRGWADEAGPGASLAILRPAAVIGPGSRGNVQRLFAQIAAGRFVMVGNGCNVKSLAHVGNVAAFLAAMVAARPARGLWNYADGPDLTTAELVTMARTELRGRPGTGPRLPRGAGLALGHLADAASALTGRALPLSAERVRKFCAETRFVRAAPLPGFVAPVTLAEGLREMLQPGRLPPQMAEAALMPD
jgi:nucleoside-diphosphate-sugar epimerase